MVVEFENLGEIRDRHIDEKIVFMGGCFDLVHEGHVLGMEYCKAMGNILVVGVSQDERVAQRKGPSRPIRNQAGRLAVVNAFEAVDYSFLMPLPGEDDSPTIQVIKTLKPDIFADTIENFDRWQNTKSYIESLGTELRFNDAPDLDSTSAIIERVLKASHVSQQ